MIEHLGGNIKAVISEDGFTSSNCMFVEDEIRLVIDSGAGRIMDGLKPESIDILVNSHHHLDHIKGNDLFTGAKKYAHALERIAMQSPEKVTATSGWNELMDEDIMEHSKTFGEVPDRIMQPWNVDDEIRDGEIIDCGSTKIQVLHTPGHTAGHCSFYFPDEHVIFTGDICLTVAGPWYGDSEADIDEFLASVETIIKINPRILVTGHRTNVIKSDIINILIEYRERILKREKRIIKFINDRPVTINEIAQQMLIYRAHPSIFVLFWEKAMVKKHLERLIRMGTVSIGEKGRYIIN